jgi:hypothetical protein
MIHTEHHPAERSEILGNDDDLIIRDLWITGKCQYYILSVTADIPHTGKGFTLGISFFAARFFASDSGIANSLKMNLTLYYMFFSVP